MQLTLSALASDHAHPTSPIVANIDLRGCIGLCLAAPRLQSASLRLDAAEQAIDAEQIGLHAADGKESAFAWLKYCC